MSSSNMYSLVVQQTQVVGSLTNYQRVGINTAIAANGSVMIIVTLPTGTKSLMAGFNTTAIASMVAVAVDGNGNPLAGSGIVSATSSTIDGAFIIPSYPGNTKIAISVTDKSGTANTLQFLDVWASI